MERKVIQLAGKTLVVSLPSKWAKCNGVKKGGSVFLEQNGNELIVRTESESVPEKVSIEAKGPFEFIERSIDTAYKKGADELEIRLDKPETIKSVEKVLDSTMGLEIISQSEKSCIIKSIAKAVDDEFNPILRRVFLTILSMGEETFASLNNFSKLDEIKGYDKTVNKLTNFCKRVLNRKGNKAGITNYMYCIIWELERIGDEYNAICDAIKGSGKYPENDALSLFAETNLFFRDFYNMFYTKPAPEKGIEFTQKHKKLLEKCNKLLMKSKGNDTLIIHRLANIITATYDIAGPYYAMELDLG